LVERFVLVAVVGGSTRAWCGMMARFRAPVFWCFCVCFCVLACGWNAMGVVGMGWNGLSDGMEFRVKMR